MIDMGHHRLSIGKISGGATNDAIGRPVGHARPANRRNHLAISASMNEGPGPYPAADLGGAHSAPPRTRACLRHRTNRGRSSSVIRKSASDPVSFRRRSGTELAVNRNIDAAIDAAGAVARQLHFGCAVLPRMPRQRSPIYPPVRGKFLATGGVPEILSSSSDAEPAEARRGVNFVTDARHMEEPGLTAGLFLPVVSRGTSAATRAGDRSRALAVLAMPLLGCC